jgi:hypothetical protein
LLPTGWARAPPAAVAATATTAIAAAAALLVSRVLATPAAHACARCQPARACAAVVASVAAAAGRAQRMHVDAMRCDAAGVSGCVRARPRRRGSYNNCCRGAEIMVTEIFEECQR